MVDKHKPHMQHLWSQGHRGTGSARCCTTSQVCGQEGEPHHAPFSTPVSTPNLTAVIRV